VSLYKKFKNYKNNFKKINIINLTFVFAIGIINTQNNKSTRRYIISEIKFDETGQGLLPFIEHEVDTVRINQRAYDGYINATELCTACGKKYADYDRLKNTNEFLEEVSSDMGIPISELVQKVKGGNRKKEQGTWVHPRVAVNLGQWASAKFANLVSKWVFEWMEGTQKTQYKIPYHIRRYLINRSRIPHTHFSMLDEMTLRLVAPLEQHGYILPTNLMPDISMGRMFSKWCRDNGYEPDNFPSYRHEFDDGKRAPVYARLYPNEIITEFRLYFNQIWLQQKGLDYFSKKDKSILPYLKKVIAELPKGTTKTIID